MRFRERLVLFIILLSYISSLAAGETIEVIYDDFLSKLEQDAVLSLRPDFGGTEGFVNQVPTNRYFKKDTNNNWIEKNLADAPNGRYSLIWTLDFGIKLEQATISVEMYKGDANESSVMSYSLDGVEWIQFAVLSETWKSVPFTVDVSFPVTSTGLLFIRWDYFKAGPDSFRRMFISNLKVVASGSQPIKTEVFGLNFGYGASRDWLLSLTPQWGGDTTLTDAEATDDYFTRNISTPEQIEWVSTAPNGRYTLKGYVPFGFVPESFNISVELFKANGNQQARLEYSLDGQNWDTVGSAIPYSYNYFSLDVPNNQGVSGIWLRWYFEKPGSDGIWECGLRNLRVVAYKYLDLPSAPTSLSAEPQQGQIWLTWDPVPDCTYNIYRSQTDIITESDLLVSGVQEPWYMDRAVLPHSDYRYAVAAVVSSNFTSPLSEEVVVKSGANPNLSQWAFGEAFAARLQEQARLSFQPAGGGTGGFSNQIPTEEYIKVISLDEINMNIDTAPNGFYQLDWKLTPPFNTITSVQVTAEFYYADAGQQCRLLISTDGQEWTEIYKVANKYEWQTVTVTKTDLGCNEIWLRWAYSKGGSEGFRSQNMRNLRVIVSGYNLPPIPPTQLQADSSFSGLIKLTWNPSPEARSYSVYRSTSPDISLSITPLQEGITAAEFTDIIHEEGYYYYMVAAVDALGMKSASEIIEVQSSVYREKPKPVLNLTADNSIPDKIILSWEPQKDENFELLGIVYYVYRGTVSGFEVSKPPYAIIESDEDVVVWSDLEVEGAPGYYYRVSAVDIFGNESELSEEVFVEQPQITQLTLKALPISLAEINKEIEFVAKVWTDSGTISGVVYYRRKGTEQYASIPFTLDDENNRYVAKLPADEVTGDLEYYVMFTNGTRVVTGPGVANQLRPQTIKVANIETETLAISSATIYPNPFVPGAAYFGETVLSFVLGHDATIQGAIYSMSGEVVKRFAPTDCSRGIVQLNWDGRDDRGRLVGNGVYIWHILATHQDFYGRRAEIKQGIVVIK